MKHIKDFLYNWNDIVIILLILVGATALISWRVDKIMEYPSTLVNEVTEQEAEAEKQEEAEAEKKEEEAKEEEEKTEEEAAEESEAAENNEAEEGNAEENAEEANSEENSEEAAASAEDAVDTPENTNWQPGEGPLDNSVWKDKQLRSGITLTTASGTAYDAVDTLIDAGLFTSFDDYFSVCMRVGVDSSAIKSATFTFDQGATQEDIVKQVTA